MRSDLTPQQLDRALEVARRLWALADELYGARQQRVDDADLARNHWRGPQSRVFGDLNDLETTSTWSAIENLRAEADLWANFWADSMTGWNQKKRDNELENYDNEWLQDDGSYAADAGPRPAKTVERVRAPSDYKT